MFGAWIAIVGLALLTAGLVRSLAKRFKARSNDRDWLAFLERAPSGADQLVMRARRVAANVLALLSPVLSGLVLYWWLEWDPKTWADPQCGLADAAVLSFIPFLAFPPLFAGVRLRQTGRNRTTAIAVTFVALLVTVLACAIAFFVWFAEHKCGE